MHRKIYLLVLLTLGLFSAAWTQSRIITDQDLVAGGNYNWSSDTTYQLDGYVFLEAGGILNIEAGTRIEGLATPSNSADLASALIITRDAQIFAEGTAAAPIVFTAEGETGNFELPDDRGSWGGLILLGNGVVGDENSSGTANIEGIPVESRTIYGGGATADNDDNSGTLRYVSIRYGGALLADNNEINGLTLGGVGRGTTLEYIEVFGNEDDGIEFFGGAVDLKYAVVAFCGDDSFDTDQRWSGRGQYWFAIQTTADATGNNQNGGEHDGSEDPSGPDGETAVVFNATYIGMGPTAADDNGEGNTGLRIRNRAAFSYNNSIFTEFGRDGLRLQDIAYDRYLADEFQLQNNIWFGFGDGNNPTDFVRVDDGDDAGAVITKLLAEGNSVNDPSLNGVSRMPNAMLDPRPGAGSPARAGALEPSDMFFDATTFRGAFPADNNWARGWTNLDALGYFGDLSPQGENIVITDTDLVGGQEYFWTSENVYQLDGYVFLEAGSCLNIEAGTRIEGLATPSNPADLASALIITRGAQIKAIGTAEAPIVFTAEGETGNFELPDDRGTWGGLIILGNGIVGDENSSGTANIEGIPVEDRTIYGGGTNPDNGDDSGILRYVSIRYGGALLADNNEINGLTLGGVGSGTTLEYIEVFGNEDDGIEFFGGAVDLKYAVVAFCGDDAFDTDQSWAGRGQFWFAIQLPADATGNNQNGGEHDGSEDPSGPDGPVITVYNATYIGMGPASADDNGEGNTALRIRNRAAISYNNSIFTEFGRDGLRLQDIAYDRYLADEFKLRNNLWFGFGDGDTPADFVRVDDGDDANAVITKLLAEGNEVGDPELGGISRAPEMALDPRPNFSSPAYGNLADIPSEDFYSDVNYRGAFTVGDSEGDDSDYWILDWTNLDQLGYLGDLALVNTVALGSNGAGVRMSVPNPNPVVNQSYLAVSLPGASQASLLIYDQVGRLVSRTALGNLIPGENQIPVLAGNLPNGHYFLLLETEYGVVAQRMVVAR